MSPRYRRRSGWDVESTRPSGVLAMHDGTCDRCDRPIQRHVHQVVERKGTWIHVRCYAGGDE